MPLPPAPDKAPALPLRTLLLLTSAVALAHWLVLGGLPLGLTWFAPPIDVSATRAVAARLVTRTLPPEPIASTPPPVKPKPVPSKATPAPEATPSSTPAVPAQATDEVASMVSNAAPATDTSAAAAQAPVDPVPAASSAAPSPLAPAPAAASAAEVQHAKKVQFAGPVVLQYDGKGEADGYKKYAASGELQWQPDALQYKAKLEITALFFRVRTWTSKGELTDGGLQPLRFGDKPRGAEQATHFQRDKGIISFSANNPDVPLQPGAQDKLSALIQLSAMVAGDPEQYPAGSSIRFQAADAHRAEMWNFKAGAAEDLDLPGGTLRAIPFTKDPTMEFDQRIEVWLASTMQYLPVRIRVTESSGNYVDLLWRKTQTPD